MAHAFDTGAAKPQRTLIQQGAIALLAGLKRPAGYLVSVVPFGAAVRSYRDEDGVAMVVDSIGGRAPAIAVALGDRASEPSGIGGYSSTSQLDLLVYFASSNARNYQLGRQEMDAVAVAADTSDPGLHVMMEHAAELLIGQRCGGTASIKQIRCATEMELATTPAVTIWLQTYHVTTVNTAREWRTATQLLESIGLGLQLDPLPGDPELESDPSPPDLYVEINL